MTRVVVLVENTQGALEALLFESGGHAIAWENAHPQVTDYIRGQAPLTGRRAVLQEVHRAEMAALRSLSADPLPEGWYHVFRQMPHRVVWEIHYLVGKPKRTVCGAEFTGWGDPVGDPGAYSYPPCTTCLQWVLNA